MHLSAYYSLTYLNLHKYDENKQGMLKENNRVSA